MPVKRRPVPERGRRRSWANAVGHVTIVGPIILLVALFWVVMRSRRRPAKPDRAHRARDRGQLRGRGTRRRRRHGRRLSEPRCPSRRSAGSPSAAGSRGGTSSRCWPRRAPAAAPAGRADRRGQDAGRLPADALRAGRAAGRGAAHPLCFAAEGAGGRRPAQPARPRSRRWTCRSGSRPAPATRRPTARRGSGCGRRRSC